MILCWMLITLLKLYFEIIKIISNQLNLIKKFLLPAKISNFIDFQKY